jgi:hypothetical protein
VHSFLSTFGIVFRLSCPHTSPQNGKAERAIHSINDIKRTLLFQSHLKPSYWVDALHTATYLYNCRPSHPLHLMTPYETLFLQRPDYSHLRTFGYLCFPNLSTTTPHKLAPRSTPCVFIGYPNEHKGYCCLELSLHKVITSRYVFFDEFSFPLATQQTTISQPPQPATPDPPVSTLDLIPVRTRHPPRIAQQTTCANNRIPDPSLRAPCGPARNSVPMLHQPPPLANPVATPGPPITTPARPPDLATTTSHAPAHTPPVNTVSPLPPASSTHQFKHPIQAPQEYMHTRSKSGIVVPKKHFNLSTSVIVSPITTNYRSALKDPNWFNAM